MDISLYVASTPYHILSSVLDMYLQKKRGVVILLSNFEDDYNFFKKISVRMLKYRWIADVIVIPPGGKVRRVLGYHKYYKYICQRYSVGDVIISPWNLIKMYSNGNYFFNKFKNTNRIILFEDGSNVYLSSEFRVSLLEKIVYRLFNIKMLKDFIPYVDKIVVSYPHKFPDRIQDKLEERNISDVLSNLNFNDKKEITGIFLNSEDTNVLEGLKEKQCKSIIFTQPFFRDGLMDERSQKELFDNLIVKYAVQGPLIVKKHPRDNVDYSVPTGCILIEGKFPSELLSSFGIIFSKSIGISSSATKSVKAKEYINEEIL